VVPPCVDEDGEGDDHKRRDGDHRVAQDSSEDHARRVCSDGHYHHGPRASRSARARERSEADARREWELSPGPT
jgi:hypothetical protein